MVPTRTVANGRQRLQSSLQRTHAHTGPLEYGFLIHTRKEPYRLVLGIITLAGESMPLTPSLLASLEGQDLWLSGQTNVIFEPMVPASGDHGRPCDTLLMTVLPESIHPSDLSDELDPGELIDIRDDEDEPLSGIEAYVCADSLLKPLVVLTASRPAGWPR